MFFWKSYCVVVVAICSNSWVFVVIGDCICVITRLGRCYFYYCCIVERLEWPFFNYFYHINYRLLPQSRWWDFCCCRCCCCWWCYFCFYFCFCCAVGQAAKRIATFCIRLRFEHLILLIQDVDRLFKFYDSRLGFVIFALPCFTDSFLVSWLAAMLGYPIYATGICALGSLTISF